MRVHQLLLPALAGAGFCLAGSAQATTVMDHFNSYGDERRDLMGLGDAVGGWAAGWGVHPDTSAAWGSDRPDYAPDTRLTYNSAYYNNLPNAAGPDSGVATNWVDGVIHSSAVVHRAFETPMSGTIWISALGQLPVEFIPPGAQSNGPDVLIWLNRGSSPAQNHFFGFRDQILTDQPKTAALRLAGENQIGPADLIQGDVPNLLLAKVEIVPGTSGAISIWANPDLSGGEAGLGTPVLHLDNASDVFGGALSNIGISFAYPGSMLDSLRVSNAANGFEMVTLAAAPQPLQGDANRDGRVDGEDFLIWQANFGKQPDGIWEEGDFNGDGRIDGEDFLIWQSHFGSAITSTAATPEPAAAMLLGLAGLLCLRRRTRCGGREFS